ncbi:hypothetical protein DFH09DRAFT_1373508 [Mycena vulgaris]|nr:hypothetical protein DFH09DRAFT_1373508 [Mycena vulgaris]
MPLPLSTNPRPEILPIRAYGGTSRPVPLLRPCSSSSNLTAQPSEFHAPLPLAPRYALPRRDPEQVGSPPESESKPSRGPVAGKGAFLPHPNVRQIDHARTYISSADDARLHSSGYCRRAGPAQSGEPRDVKDELHACQPLRCIPSSPTRPRTQRQVPANHRHTGRGIPQLHALPALFPSTGRSLQVARGARTESRPPSSKSTQLAHRAPRRRAPLRARASPSRPTAWEIYHSPRHAERADDTLRLLRISSRRDASVLLGCTAPSAFRPAPDSSRAAGTLMCKRASSLPLPPIPSPLPHPSRPTPPSLPAPICRPLHPSLSPLSLLPAPPDIPTIQCGMPKWECRQRSGGRQRGLWNRTTARGGEL